MDSATHIAANWKGGGDEEKRAVIQARASKAALDGDRFEAHPSDEKIAGVKMASPRGVEPLLPP